MRYWNALFNRGTKEAKKAFEANMHLIANSCEKTIIIYYLFLCARKWSNEYSNSIPTSRKK